MTPPRINDLTLATLDGLRSDLLARLAHVLRRVGPYHPHRKLVNKQRALQRKRLRKEIRKTEGQIVARVALLYRTPVSAVELEKVKTTFRKRYAGTR